MKHYTKRERRLRRSGYNEGYNAGYKQGLHDGNPFIAIAETATKAVNSLVKTFADPEFQKVLREYSEKENYFEMWEEEENAEI